MPQVFKIPVTPQRTQKFGIALNGIPYNLRFAWNAAHQSWIMDILDADNNRLLMGVPLITGADLLAQHAHLNIGVNSTAGTWIEMFVVTYAIDKPPVTTPLYSSFGIDSNLYYVVRP